MGVFNRNVTGHVSVPIAVTLERGALIFFAETIGETNPVHFDILSARAAGYPDILAPPTYAAVVGSQADHAARRQGHGLTSTLDLINADYRHVLHGMESYDYHSSFFAGDQVTVTTEIKGFSDVKGGKLEIAHISQKIKHPERGLLVEISRDIIHQLDRSALP
ncbi:MaoC family dehydratase N-terminal domain-containing protein [Pseudopelagicola sp. nBUS_20]|uniref:FAS1-like dehydratase domain-containing protein n=1 Tax=Pseudopelagicola sp. nBUS_20 TaxID=3395317 RepID=UPI003EB93163